MRKVWNTLVVLGILLCMVMSLGVTADAAEGEAAIFAVSDAQLAPESVELMATECPQCLVIDVDGLEDGQPALGYNVVYAPSDPQTMTDYAYIWPGFAQMFEIGTQARKVVLVGVGEASSVDEINAAIGAYLADEPYIIAVGPAAAAAAVGGCADVDMFMTSGLDDEAAAAAATEAGAAVLVNVGKEETPVGLVKVNEDGTASAEDIPVPQPVADPGVGPAEGEPAAEGDDGSEEAANGLVTAPGPVIDVPEIDAPETVIYYAVKYDGNGRDEGTYVDDDLQVAGGSEYTLRDNGYTRVGYNFVGWTLDAPDTEPVYQPGDTIVVSGNVTVYAKWEAVAAEEPADGDPVDEPTAGSPEENGDPITAGAQPTVTYKAGEGEGNEQPFRFDSDTEIVLPDGSAFTAPEGKKFSGWLMEGTEEIYDAQTPYTVTGDVTFVAQYRQYFTVAYDFGDSGNENYSDEVFEGEAYGLAAAPTVIPENMSFGGWLLDSSEQKQPGEEITVTGNVTVTPVWNSTEPVAVNTEIAVTYKGGVEGMTDMSATAPANGKFNLPECPFAAPDGQAFAGWKLEGGDGTLLAVSAEVPTGTEDLVFVAQWESLVQATVTYLPGDGSDKKFEETTDSFKNGGSVQYTLKDLPDDFTAPDGKTFGGWKIGDSTYKAGDPVTVSENVTVTAIWNDVAKEKVDPAVDTDSLMYTKSATDKLEVSFKAKIDTVSVDNAALTLGSQYGVTEDGETSTVFFDNNYLNGLTEGDHTLNVTFAATDTTEYTPNTRTLTIKAAPVEQTNKITTVQQEWDRSKDLTIDFASYDRGNPIKLELLRAYERDDSGNYKKDANGDYIPVWKELTKDQDFSVSGTSLTVHPSLLGQWDNQQYGFRVTFDGAGTDMGTNTVLLYLNVTGTKQAQSDPAATAAAGSSGYVTGEGVNLRAGAGTNSQVLRTVAKGTKITIYSISNGWAYVSVDGVNGYMSADYVAYDNATPTATPDGATSPATGDPHEPVVLAVILVVLIAALAAVLIIVIKRRNRK